MIRRNVTLDDGSRRWWLISQVEHARISYELAEAWGNGSTPYVICAPDDDSSERFATRDVVLQTILHHDDGWGEWHKDPAFDPAAGRPYSFTEMPRDESLAIWQQSVNLVESISPLASWVVAGHFAALLNGSEVPPDQATRVWQGEMQDRCDDWLPQWMAERPQVHTPALANEALRWLRCFDALSLWFCCGTSNQFEFPPIERADDVRGQSVRFISGDNQGGERQGGSHIVNASPWPFAPDCNRIVLSVPALQIPARRYVKSSDATKVGLEIRHTWNVQREDSTTRSNEHYN